MSEKKNDTISEVLNIFNNNWNKQVILYGPPGTSKTYSSTIIAAKFLGKETNDYDEASKFLKTCDNYKLVQFHPSYSYEDFVRGISVKTKDGGDGVKYETESKIIEKFIRFSKDGSLRNNSENMVLVIDEINRAPLASVLGELIYGLEYRGEEISTPYEVKDKSKKVIPLTIPDNLYIIGTMNTADRSIGSIDYAVRRRFAFVQVGSNDEMIYSSWVNKVAGKKAKALYDAFMGDGGIFDDLLEDNELDVEDIKIGHTYFLGDLKGNKEGDKDESALNYLDYRIKYQVAPIYEEYIKDGLIKPEGKDRFNKIYADVMGSEKELPFS